MTSHDIARSRLSNQRIASSPCRTPAEVVAALGAMQAQDYLGGLWSVGVRLPGTTEAAVEEAIAGRRIIRTWPMRGTLHFVAAQDVRWMLELLTPRIIAGSARRWRLLELEEAVFARSRKLFIHALEGDGQLTRDAMMELLERDGISTAGLRGYHILWRLAQEGLLCFAAREGKQHAFALLEKWAPQARSLDRDQALAELARRYFTGHGPATLHDFAWWSGLKVADAKAGLDSVRSELCSETVADSDYWTGRNAPALPNSRTAYLLPGFDEFLLGYTDRSATLDAQHRTKVLLIANGRFLGTIVIDGRVAGTWKRDLKKKEVVVTTTAFRALKAGERRLVEAAADNYGRFLQMPVSFV